MAGIGFELRRLFAGDGVLRKVRAYAYAGIVTAGTMMMAMALLLGMERIARLSGAGERERETLVAMVVYAMLLSMLLTAFFQTFLSRYVADMLYEDTPGRVMPSLVGSSLLLMVPGGLLYGALLASASVIPLFDRVLNWLLFMELIPVWLTMTYLTAVKDYRRILIVFGAGVALALAIGVMLIAMRLGVRTAFLCALCAGYGAMLVGFAHVLTRYFVMSPGSAFHFARWFARVPGLLAIGFFTMAGAFVHLIIMWFGPLGYAVEGVFRNAPSHDTAAFYAFLVTIPTNINFVVSVEVNFYREYRRYFDLIGGGGTLPEIAQAREGMIAVLKQEVAKLARTQVLFMVGYIVLMPYFLRTIGFTADMIAMFQVMGVGYSAYAIGNSLVLLQLYFNDRAGALLTSATFFAVNALVTILTMNGPALYYGAGLAAAGAAMYLVALMRLRRYVADIDHHVYCGQPLLATEEDGRWTRAVHLINARFAGGGQTKPRGKEGVSA